MLAKEANNLDNELMLLKLIEDFQLFVEFNEKCFIENYSNLNINEVHAIDYIGKANHANVTKIAEHLKVTKGAVTKITQRLMSKGYLNLHQSENNRKEKYFSLTEKGKAIFDKHKKIHKESIKRDKDIFEKFDENEKIVIEKFLDVLKKDFEEKLE